MVGLTEKEIKHAIRSFVAFLDNIRQLEAKYGFTIDNYTHAINIERFVVLDKKRLIGNYRRLDCDISYLKRFYLPIDYPTLKTLLKHDILTNYEVMIYQEIQEINYYIDQHKRTLAQQQADDEIVSLDLNEDDIAQMLNSDDWDTPKETKISMLSNVEDELMALLA